jgi:hypothetical protein
VAMSNDSETRGEQTGVLGHLFGVWYPKHYLVGIIEDRSSAESAAEALRTAWRDAGASDEAVRLFHPDEAREAIRRTEGSYGPARRAIATLSRDVGSEEGVADQEYQAAIKQGSNVLAVLAPTPEDVDRARAVLAKFKVQHLRHYGALAVTDLD